MASRPTASGLLSLLLPVLAAAFLVAPAGASLVLTQETGENPVNTIHTVVATAVDDTLESPLVGISVVFQVLSGPNAAATGTCSGNADCTTDTTGVVSFAYLGSGGAGTDVIQAFYVAGEADTVRSNLLPKTWIAANQPPVAQCQDVTVPADEDCLVEASVDDGSFDPDGDPITLVQEPAGPYGLGETPVRLIVTDDEGAADTCAAVVTVIDVTPPEITVELNRDALWPPNHKLVEVCAEVTVTDNCDPAPTWVLSDASSNEADDTKKGGGDGNTVNDIQDADLGTADVCVLLRSERRGNGDGRVYTLEYTATDAGGNTATATVTVDVPHDQSGNAMAAEGNGLLDDSVRLQLVVPSHGGFDAAAVDARHAIVGNQQGVVSPEAWRLQDVVGDARGDLVLTYSAAALQVAVGGSPKGSIDFHYRADGKSFLVKDISELAAVYVPAVAEDENAPGGNTGSDPGNDGAIGRVEVQIFDIQGRIVRSFARDGLPADVSSLGWDGYDASGRRVPQGIYFYRIETPSVKFVRKVTILR
jgi:hypothetical protein